jgi:glycosyltransferase involved in cell wall biosynthesis
MKVLARDLVRAGICQGYSALRTLGLHDAKFPPVNFVIERADWAIRWVGTYVCDGIEAEHPGTASVTTNPAPIAGRVVHFGSQYMWLMWGSHMARSNRFVTSFFHGKPEDGPDVAKHIDTFVKSIPRLSKIVTGASLVERRLLDWGVPREKLVKIPIGCDTTLFQPPTPEQRRNARSKLGIPDNHTCIGSFQKDGVGWGDGTEPKLIKGPDVFIDAVRKLADYMPVFVLLTGPARGYVRLGLERYGIPYRHDFLSDYRDIAPHYHALDLYLVTSREEGGPMALMESMATHVPVVSTKVGQAADLVTDMVTGGLVDVDDVEGMCERSLALLAATPEQRTARAVKARETVVRGFDWHHIARQHYEQVYRPLLK